MLTLPITDQAKKKEWEKILNIAPKNDFPINIIYNIKKKEIAKQKEKLVKKRKTNKTNRIKNG
jgi:hypothetical protein